MPLEWETRDGALLWVKNPFNGTISYVVDVEGKSFAYTLANNQPGAHAGAVALDAETARRLSAECPFCPGNEAMSPDEVMRISMDPAEEGRESPGGSDRVAPWAVRVVNNLFPRVPASLTGGRNESYIVVEDPRHFLPAARSPDDLLYSAALSESQFLRGIEADVLVMRRALENPAVRSLVVRKNQGRESGASQPHIHHQIIGSASLLPALQAEVTATRHHPELWHEAIALAERFDLIIERGDGIVTYMSPVGQFPHSYDVVMPEFRKQLCDLEPSGLRRFARALHRALQVFGANPLDCEIHQGQDLPLHGHVNGRLFPYSNVAGTLNLPRSLLKRAADVRRNLARRP